MLQLIGVLVEVLGPDLADYLSIVASALPPLWEASTEKSAATGAAVRLHSALIGLLTHLVTKLRGAAVNNPQVRTHIRHLCVMLDNTSFFALVTAIRGCAVR